MGAVTVLGMNIIEEHRSKVRSGEHTFSIELKPLPSTKFEGKLGRIPDVRVKAITVIGPLGAYLKPDQQFRIALARAFLHDPSIVIIEEPDSKMEEDTRSFIDDTVISETPYYYQVSVVTTVGESERSSAVLGVLLPSARSCKRQWGATAEQGRGPPREPMSGCDAAGRVAAPAIDRVRPTMEPAAW